MTTSSNSTSPSSAGWAACLELEVAAVARSRSAESLASPVPVQSTIVARRHVGPFVVQRPFHPEPDGTCHVLLVHPPGGLVSGDSLTLLARLQPGARALLTTPAATKLYRARDGAGPARQHVSLVLASAAELEYFPQETIAFDAARARLVTEVELGRGARFFGWEIVCLGRPAAGEGFARGELELCLRVSREGRLVLVERLRTSASLLAGPAGLRGEPVVGTFVVAGGAPCRGDEPASEVALTLAEAARAGLAGLALRGLCAVTARGELVITRYLGPSAEQARSAFEQVWRTLRPLVFGKPAVSPRIWRT
jgi:urease accessory protein